MSKPYTERDLSDLFDNDLVWRRRELSDMKSAVRAADSVARRVLLRAILTMIYAHWEGYVRECASRYFEYLAIRKKPYAELERQVYVNTFLARLDALHRGRVSLRAKCQIISDILDGGSGEFRYIDPALIDTKSNLNTDVVTDICIICSVDPSHFEAKRIFIDQIILRRRNSIAHGQQELIQEEELDSLIDEILGLMQHFRTLLENKIYLKQYAA